MSLHAGDVVSLDKEGGEPSGSGRVADTPPAPRGFTVFMTGLPGAGKSTLVRGVNDRLVEAGRRRIQILDGEMFRASTLANADVFRDVTTARMAVVAGEVTRGGGVALCAAVAPFDGARGAARRRIAPWGRFILVYLSTPLAVCEQRDRQALYRDARLGRVSCLTGVTHVYEAPRDADITLDTSLTTIEASTDLVMLRLRREGLVG
jgi:sulfate adenylyltransferase